MWMQVDHVVPMWPSMFMHESGNTSFLYIVKCILRGKRSVTCIFFLSQYSRRNALVLLFVNYFIDGTYLFMVQFPKGIMTDLSVLISFLGFLGKCLF